MLAAYAGIFFLGIKTRGKSSARPDIEVKYYINGKVRTCLLEEMIKRINQLAKKKKEEGLTPEELKEQKELYAVYLQNIRQQVKAQLDNRVIPSRQQEYRI
jgi:uncharacterized protein YnzC (UPF0291/DUF896 family)